MARPWGDEAEIDRRNVVGSKCPKRSGHVAVGQREGPNAALLVTLENLVKASTIDPEVTVLVPA
jgi:hypothetical protein